MPYTKQHERSKDNIKNIEKVCPDNSADLNYCMTILMNNYMEEKGLSYNVIRDIIAASVGSLGEFQDKIVKSYEDKCMKTNGSVWSKKFTLGCKIKEEI